MFGLLGYDVLVTSNLIYINQDGCQFMTVCIHGDLIVLHHCDDTLTAWPVPWPNIPLSHIILTLGQRVFGSIIVLLLGKVMTDITFGKSSTWLSWGSLIPGRPYWEACFVLGIIRCVEYDIGLVRRSLKASAIVHLRSKSMWVGNPFRVFWFLKSKEA